MTDPKADLHHYLQAARDALLWKLDGLSEYDIRRPMTPTGTNLLGLVKHLTGVEIGYFGKTFGRSVEYPPWVTDHAEDNVDMWATPGESREYIVGQYRTAWAHADIVRELVDGTVGLRADNTNLPAEDRMWWETYRTRLERAAREADRG
ncbi:MULTISPECIES: DUF664 domain-containing protein [Rhodococcus]|uniref:DUF664 domain-containing protein n=1 Tax=Rhodococcus jostii TaxID=132919 RepID=A0ABU4C643_RHOJO|nr:MULTISPECIES: DUF664 domain-containing protein [Rhodococcus]MDI9950571.1 DUF664 domain-containing protein [Rhodococcus sp. IEGM 1305]MDV6278939.1 DUF664 domain-containing protein [Rhodococcus jostii]